MFIVNRMVCERHAEAIVKVYSCILVVFWMCVINASFLLCCLYFIKKQKMMVIQEQWEEGWASLKHVLHLSTDDSRLARTVFLTWEYVIFNSRQVVTCKQHFLVATFFLQVKCFEHLFLPICPMFISASPKWHKSLYGLRTPKGSCIGVKGGPWGDIR